MNTVNPLKRPLTVSSDQWKSLACKICEKDDNILNLKTCGCLFCVICDGDSRDICINLSCQSKVDPKIKLSFTKNIRCKYYEQCNSSAEYKCKCLPDCFVCCLCLANIHSKRVHEPCVPENLRLKVTTHEPCQMCKEFIAEFEIQHNSENLTSEHSKICFNCKTNNNITCTPYDNDSGWNELYGEFEQSSQIISEKIKKLKKEISLANSKLANEKRKCESAIVEIQKSFSEFCAVTNRTLESKLDGSKKEADCLSPDGTMKTILDLLKNKQLTLHGKNGKKQICNFLHFYREKNDYIVLMPEIKTTTVQNHSRRQHILKFPLPSPSTSVVSAESSVSVQENIYNGVKAVFISVEKPSAVDERKKIFEDIQKHQDKWVHKKHFAKNDIVIIFDAGATEMQLKYKRAKIVKREKDICTVFLLDFGFQIRVENSSIGEINEISINGKQTCFIAQITGSIGVNFDLKRKDGSPTAILIKVNN